MSATIYSAEEIGIDKKHISKNALKVVNSLQEAGYVAYLVGGCVRDLLLNMKPKDFDVATDATPEQIKSAIRGSRIIGRRFKLVHVRFGYEVIEVATFRASANDRTKVGKQEMSEGEQGQLLRDNVYGTIDEDVVRRDFKANALYYDPIKNEVLDFVDGLDDIKQKKLCSIGEAKQRFREDPVRMLRVIRFAGKLGFSMEDGALDMIEQEGSLLSHVSPARLFDEVLKLFHGGAAYDTYLLLRKYGLFKYLFPFTDHSVVEGEEGMPEKALQNTDKRIREGKPVIPAFLFASMMWDPVKADAQVLMSEGTREAQAWKIAMQDGLRDQNQYVAVPRRLAEIIIDIWEIHFRLIKRNPRMIQPCINNRRFRAAYDFLLLRSSLHEVDGELAQWWTDIQEVDADTQKRMVDEVSESYKSQKQKRYQHNDRETDGNSINYNSAGNNYNNPVPGQQRNNKPNKSNGRYSKKRTNRNRAGGYSDGGGNVGRGNNANGGNQPRSNRGRNGGVTRSRNVNRRNNSQQGGQHRKNTHFSDATPKDEFGNHQTASHSSNDKKVKVRHKRKIVTQADKDEPSVF